jgi:drug/metabolite transporter (DMT)-like permease
VTTLVPTDAAPRLQGQAAGILLVVVSACGFGSGALLVQPLYAAGMEPLPVLFWRFATAAAFSWLYLSLRSRTRASLGALSQRRVLVLVLLGALYVGNSFAYFAALQVVPIALTSIITYLYPAIVAVMGWRVVRRLEGRRAWVALGLSILGVALAVGGIPEGELPPLWGLGLAFANALIYATWIVLQARLAGERPARDAGPRPVAKLTVPPGDAETAIDVATEVAPAAGAGAARASAPDPAAAAAIMTTATAGTYALLASTFGAPISPAGVPAGLWPTLLAFGLVATALAIQTFYAGVRRIGAARASIVSTVEPVYTIALAVILFGETLAPVQILGGALVIAAVILAESGRPEPAEPEAPFEPARAGPGR